MQIELTNYTSEIDEELLKRGLAFVIENKINLTEANSNGGIKFEVDSYHVELLIKKDIIQKYFCDCVDENPICKHIAASIIYTHKNFKDVFKNVKKSKVKLTIKDKVIEIMDQLSFDELKEYIIENTQKDESFGNKFLIYFSHYNYEELSKADYKKQIKSIVKSNKVRAGFYDRRSALEFFNDFEALFEITDKFIESKKYNQAFLISTTIMEEVYPVFINTHDGSGTIPSIIDIACNDLIEISNLELPDSMRIELLNYSLNAFDKKLFDGYEWEFNMLEIAFNLILSEEELKKFEEFINKNDVNSYLIEKCKLLHYNLLIKLGKLEVAKELLYLNIEYPKIREKAINYEIENKNYEQAKSIAKEGINLISNFNVYIRYIWRKYLLKIAQIENNVNEILQYAHELIFEDRSNSDEYYFILKNHAENWNEYVELLIKDFTDSKSFSRSEILGQIYIHENMIDRLFNFAKNDALRIIDLYEKYLFPNYPNEIIEIYCDYVMSFLDRNGLERKHYTEACKIISHVIKLGYRDNAIESIKVLQALYPRRKSLLEELDKIKV